MRNKIDMNGPSLFEEIGEIVIKPFDSACNILFDALEGNIPKSKDVVTIVGAVASLWLITRIF